MSLNISENITPYRPKCETGDVSSSHNSVNVQNRTHVYTKCFDHKDLWNHLLQ